ncbi:hypothetical protein PAXRUDRAFT_15514 [Paxillus rubicundulus Ve08.2h10]|uniref:Uncharacterized protein n=1 Tax=Paxillus rubicundulus Ve08.2h10 TaxID=930991 RepID=A0A0D0DPN4_9AGAM|nr:hypothetical protein PAXRUDRAFT_15514 [Paxillus rubicundulus Ve08.2h10]
MTTGSSIDNSLFEQPLSMDLVGAVYTIENQTCHSHTFDEEALKSGGAADLGVEEVLKVMREPIEFYLIPTCAITEILANPHKQLFNIETVNLLTGQLRLNTEVEGIVGIGGFKTAQLAQMILSTLPSSGLGSQPCHNIITKQPYICKEGGPGASGPPYSHFNMPDKLEKNF